MNSASRPICILVLIFSFIPLHSKHCLGADGQLSFQRESARLAAKMAINKLQERGNVFTIEVESLKDKMTSNTAKYQKGKVSWTELREKARTDFINWYEKEVEIILQGLNRNKPKEVVNYFTKEEIESWSRPSGETIDAFLINNFGTDYDPQDKTSVFSKSRKKACEEQWNEMILNVYPTETELETHPREKIYSKLVNEATNNQKGIIIFEENKALIGTGYVDRILDDAYDQLNRQRSIVGYFSGGGIERNEIERFIYDTLQEYQNNLKKARMGKTIAKKVYSVFPSVEKQIKSKSNELAKARFINELGKVKLYIGKDNIKDVIKKDMLTHANRSKSWEIIVNRYQQTIQSKAIGNYVAKVPKLKQLDFHSYLIELANNDRDCKQAITKMVERNLEQDFSDTRLEISQEQFSELFGPLKNGTWKPQEQEIDSRYNATEEEIAIWEPMKMLGICSKPFDQEVLLEETCKLVHEKEKALIKRGLDALKTQMRIVKDCEPEVNKKRDRMENPNLEKLTQIYTTRVKSIWSEWSESQLAGEYRGLFKRTIEEIEIRAKAMMKDRTYIARLEENERRIGDPSEGRLVKSGLDGDGLGDPYGVYSVDTIIDIDLVNDRFVVDIMFPERTPYTFEFSMGRPGGVDKTTLEVYVARIQSLFEMWFQSFEEDERRQHYVLARIFEGSVYYDIIFGIRESVRKATKTVRTRNLNVYWHDHRFSDKSEKGKREISDFINSQFSLLRDSEGSI